MQNRKTNIRQETFLFKTTALIVTLFVVVIPFSFFMIFLNRVKIYGKKNLQESHLPFLFVSNHVSILDDMFIGPLLFTPRGFFNYKFMPYHTPEQKNFFLGPIISWIMVHLKCIPLTRGKGFNQPGVQTIIDKLKDGGCVHIYPEGTRTRSGRLGQGKAGVGKIVFESRCKVIPCYHHGLDKVLPIGVKIPRPFHKITVSIGEPLDFSSYFALENKVETWQKISDDMIQAIRTLREDLKVKKLI